MAKKSGLRLDRVIAIKETLRRRIDEFITLTVLDQRTHSWAIERMNAQVYSQPDFARLPEWARSELRGYYHAKLDMIHRYMTVFAYKCEGKLYRTESSYARSLWMTPKLDWPHWSQYQDALHAQGRVFMTELAEEHGSFWPSGKPYSTTVNESKVVEHAAA